MNGSRTASEPILTGTLGQSDEHGLFLFKAMGGSGHALASSRLPQQSFYRVPWNVFPMGNTVPHILKLFSSCSCFLFPIAEPWFTPAGSAPPSLLRAACPTCGSVKGVPGAPHLPILQQILTPQPSWETTALSPALPYAPPPSINL